MIPRPIHKEFISKPMNKQGHQKLEILAWQFSELLEACQRHVDSSSDLSLVINKLHEAWYFAKKAINKAPENQVEENE